MKVIQSGVSALLWDVVVRARRAARLAKWALVPRAEKGARVGQSSTGRETWGLADQGRGEHEEEEVWTAPT